MLISQEGKSKNKKKVAQDDKYLDILCFIFLVLLKDYYTFS